MFRQMFSVRPKVLTAGYFDRNFGQFSAETLSPHLVIFGLSVFRQKMAISAKNMYDLNLSAFFCSALR